MIYGNFRLIDAHDIVLDYADLFFITVHDANIQEFDTRWDEVLLSMSKISFDDILESLCKLRYVSPSNSEMNWNKTTWRFIRRYRIPTIKSLKSIVKRSKDQQLRLRNFDARHERVESRAVPKSRKKLIDVEGGKDICYQWREKDQCS